MCGWLEGQAKTFRGPGCTPRLAGGGRLAGRLQELVAEMPELESIIGAAPSAQAARPATVAGHVYLVRSGEHYKIGATTDPLRREGELQIAVPGGVTPVHSLATDDPFGIEAYWHRRFANKRANGEWFLLDQDDVAAFRSRGKSM